jgi:hypothetical protein
MMEARFGEVYRGYPITCEAQSMHEAFGIDTASIGRGIIAAEGLAITQRSASVNRRAGKWRISGDHKHEAILADRVCDRRETIIYGDGMIIGYFTPSHFCGRGQIVTRGVTGQCA